MSPSHRETKKWQKPQNRSKLVSRSEDPKRYWPPKRSGRRWFWKMPYDKKEPKT